MNEIYEFIKKCGTYYLATVEGDQPRVRPFGTIDIFEDKLYIQTGKSKPVSKQIGVNPKVELSCFDGATGVWLRLAGELVNDDALADILRLGQAEVFFRGNVAQHRGAVPADRRRADSA